MNIEEIKSFIEENYYTNGINVEESEEKFFIEINFITSGLTIYVSIVKHYIVGETSKNMFKERLKNIINFEIASKFKRY